MPTHVMIRASGDPVITDGKAFTGWSVFTDHDN
jgi:hypothetical protein